MCRGHLCRYHHLISACTLYVPVRRHPIRSLRVHQTQTCSYRLALLPLWPHAPRQHRGPRTSALAVRHNQVSCSLQDQCSAHTAQRWYTVHHDDALRVRSDATGGMHCLARVAQRDTRQQSECSFHTAQQHNVTRCARLARHHTYKAQVSSSAHPQSRAAPKAAMTFSCSLVCLSML